MGRPMTRETEFDLNLTRFAAATYRLRFLARASRAEGGRSVAAEASVTSPMPYLIGYKADGISLRQQGGRSATSIWSPSVPH